jgi:hypothetical protein
MSKGGLVCFDRELVGSNGHAKAGCVGCWAGQSGSCSGTNGRLRASSGLCRLTMSTDARLERLIKSVGRPGQRLCDGGGELGVLGWPERWGARKVLAAGQDVLERQWRQCRHERYLLAAVSLISFCVCSLCCSTHVAAAAAQDGMISPAIRGQRQAAR